MPSATSARLPDFFLAGAPKAGTTSLYGFLDRHPAIYMSPIKEPCHFASEVRLENFEDNYKAQAARDARQLRAFLDGPMLDKRFGGIVSDQGDYCRLFARAGSGQVAGEASVCYLWSKTAAAAISAAIPGARIIMVLRDPVERAFSQYLHGLTNGVVQGTFGEHIRAGLNRTNDRFGPVYPFLEFGLYSAQVERYLAHFPRENIRIYDYDEYSRRPDYVLADICCLLDLEVKFERDIGATEHALAPRIARHAGIASFLKSGAIRALVPAGLTKFAKPLLYRPRQTLQMAPEDRNLLRDYYREDVARLSRLLDRDLRHWLPVERAYAAAAG